jgi:hypothetical protein
VVWPSPLVTCTPRLTPPQGCCETFFRGPPVSRCSYPNEDATVVKSMIADVRGAARSIGREIERAPEPAPCVGAADAVSRVLGRSPAALAAGDRCRTDLAASDKHFASFETTIAAAETSPSPATIKAAADATALLDGFDRSRSRYAGEAGLLVKGKEFAGLVAASDAHIAALVAVTEALAGDQSGAVYLRIADAMRQLSDFDRGRLTPGQRVSLDAANRALATLNESRTRLARLAPLLGLGRLQLIVVAGPGHLSDLAVVLLFDRLDSVDIGSLHCGLHPIVYPLIEAFDDLT